MPSRRFVQCDVFSPVPTQGNGLAVVVDADGLDDEAMQRFAAWTNLAETTFLLPPRDPRADYRLRIYTPVREIPFAGHPTLGSCAAWLHTGHTPQTPGTVRQECGVGVVDIDTSQGETLAFVAPPTQIAPLADDDLAAIVAALAIPRQAIVATAQLDNGALRQVLQLDSATRVLAVDGSRVRWPAFKPIGLLGAHPPGGECHYEVRMLAPSSGMSEDPITGSLIAALAHWLQREGKLHGPLAVAQGTALGRRGRVSVRPTAQGGAIFVGGRVHVLIEGTLML
ncbi:MAG: PhzF family phenazine biosynthesis protein [Candidatus Competibacterales bacterium]